VYSLFIRLPRYTVFVAERWCAVTVRDGKGVPHTIEVLARSLFHAASIYIGTALGKSPGQNLPLPNAETIFEVRPIGEERIYRVLGKRVQTWANAQARKQHDEVYERLNRASGAEAREADHCSRRTSRARLSSRSAINRE
jgi:hypothetical protein